MKKEEAIEGEVVERRSRRDSGRKTNVRVLRLSKIKTVLILILVIALLAFLLKFIVGFLAVILQFIVILVAVGLIGSLIYSLIKGGK